MAHVERRIREKEWVRQSILDSARKIAAKEGWQAVTIRRIADEIEYAPPILYEHFKNKEDLFNELVYSGFRAMKHDFEKVKEQETDPRKLVRELSLIRWDFAFNHTEVYQLMFNLERPVPNDEMVETMMSIKGIFSKIANGDESLAEELILYWMCLVHGSISLFIHVPAPPHLQGVDKKELFARLIDRFIASV